jgi:hypothetical protein
MSIGPPGDSPSTGKVDAWPSSPCSRRSAQRWRRIFSMTKIDRMLTAEQAAERLGTTVEWVYKNWKSKLPFGVKVSPKQLRFPEQKIGRFVALRQTA